MEELVLIICIILNARTSADSSEPGWLRVGGLVVAVLASVTLIAITLK